MALTDVFEQEVLTETVSRNVERESRGVAANQFSGATIAPLKSVRSRRIKLRFSDIKPYGLGQFKSPNATPPLFKPSPVLREEMKYLALLEEMEPFDSEEWMELKSPDPNIRITSVLGLVERMTILRNRNDQLTEWMRWEAFKGMVVAAYPDGGQYVIDYGFDPSHLPVAAIPWTNVELSDPIEDINAWSQVGADDAGAYYSKIHLNLFTWKLIQRNETLKSYLSPLGRKLLLPTQDDINQLMDQDGQFVLVDSGYLPEDSTNRRLEKFIPNSRVLMTTSYTLNGRRIADVADGQVLVTVPNSEEPAIRQGIQDELLSNKFNKQIFRRVASARLPRIYFPEAFLYGTVGA